MLCTHCDRVLQGEAGDIGDLRREGGQWGLGFSAACGWETERGRREGEVVQREGCKGKGGKGRAGQGRGAYSREGKGRGA